MANIITIISSNKMIDIDQKQTYIKFKTINLDNNRIY